METAEPNRWETAEPIRWEPGDPNKWETADPIKLENSRAYQVGKAEHISWETVDAITSETAGRIKWETADSLRLETEEPIKWETAEHNTLETAESIIWETVERIRWETAEPIMLGNSRAYHVGDVMTYLLSRCTAHLACVIISRTIGLLLQVEVSYLRTDHAFGRGVVTKCLWIHVTLHRSVSHCYVHTGRKQFVLHVLSVRGGNDEFQSIVHAPIFVAPLK